MQKHVSLLVVVLLGYLMVVVPSTAAEPKAAVEAYNRGVSIARKRNIDEAIDAFTEAIRLRRRVTIT